jgi:hypothetical protein
MSQTQAERSLPVRRAALIAGWGYLAIFLLALFANFVGREQLIEPGDAGRTLANIIDSETLFRAGTVSFMVVFVADVVIAWALYAFFRPGDRDLSLLTAWFRLVYTVLLGVALVSSLVVLELVRGEHLTAFGQAALESQVQLNLDAFDYAWLIGLACFGVHLILLGALVFRMDAAPRVIGVLLVLAGTAYVFDTLANTLLPSYEDHEDLFLAIVAVPSLIGEFAFAVWLLLRGGKAGPKHSEVRAVAPATTH